MLLASESMPGAQFLKI